MHVYEKVRDYISENGLQRPEIARKAGIPATELDEMLRGDKTMYADDLRAICLALNISPELFIGTRILTKKKEPSFTEGE